MGGEGELELDVLDSGAGPLLRACWDSTTVTPATGNGPSTITARTAPHSGAPSFTAQVLRPKADGGLVAYRHLGCMVTEWELSQEVEQALRLNVTWDFQTVSHSTAPASFLPITYPDRSVAYDWTRGAVYLTRGGSEAQIAVTKWSAKASRALKTDRRAVRANELKREPVRSEWPAYEGEFEVEFDSSTVGLYEAFTAGEILGLRIAYTGVTKAANGTPARLELNAPAIQFTGESPEASVDDLTTMSLPFVVLDPGNADAMTLTYVEPSGANPTAATVAETSDEN